LLDVLSIKNEDGKHTQHPDKESVTFLLKIWLHQKSSRCKSNSLTKSFLHPEGQQDKHCFLDPCVSKFKLQEDLFDHFNNYQTVCTGEEWLKKFSILNESALPMSLMELESEEIGILEAKAQRTPCITKLKATKEDKPPLSLLLTPYKPHVLHQEFDENMFAASNLENIFTVIEEGLVATSTSMGEIAALIETSSTDNFKELISVASWFDQANGSTATCPNTNNYKL
jgi:hypothetical protein